MTGPSVWRRKPTCRRHYRYIPLGLHYTSFHKKLSTCKNLACEKLAFGAARPKDTDVVTTLRFSVNIYCPSYLETYPCGCVDPHTSRMVPASRSRARPFGAVAPYHWLASKLGRWRVAAHALRGGVGNVIIVSWWASSTELGVRAHVQRRSSSAHAGSLSGRRVSCQWS